MLRIPRTERLIAMTPITILLLSLAATPAEALTLGTPADNDLTQRVLEARARQLLQQERNPAEIIRDQVERAKASHPPVPDVVMPPPHELLPPEPEVVPDAPAASPSDTDAADSAASPSQSELFDDEPDAAPVEPAKPTSRKYVVQKGDTLGDIAMKQLGTIKHVKAILKLNPKLDPRKMRVGQEITLPVLGAATPTKPKTESNPRTEASAKKPEKTVARSTETTVKKGETLGHISQRVYGTTRHWKHILKANSATLKDPKKLRVGMTLKIPPKPE